MLVGLILTIEESSYTYLDEQEFEWYTMNPADIVLEMEDLNEIGVLCRSLLFWHAFGIDLSVLIEVDDWVLPGRLAIESIGACFVYSYSATFGFIWDLCLLDQGLYQVLDNSSLGHEQVKLILSK